jgi:hypothetical protein
LAAKIFFNFPYSSQGDLGVVKFCAFTIKDMHSLPVSKSVVWPTMLDNSNKFRSTCLPSYHKKSEFEDSPLKALKGGGVFLIGY